ncbi:MAG: hypothetical protein WA192_16800 [Candidatus Acidiferrales bacterium]
MHIGKSLFAVVFLTGAALTASTAQAQSTATSCTASQKAAVACFVANAVTTNLTAPRYGMTLAEFESYGFAVTQILQTHHTYLVLVGISGAVADALPPKNKNGTANLAAQQAAIAQIVDAATSLGFTSPPTGTSITDLKHFAMDVTAAMNDNSGVMQMLTPGVVLRIIDSYIVTATANGQVNWTELNASLATAVTNFVGAGLIKVPPGMTASQVSSLAAALAQAIYTYKVATGLTALNDD